MKGIVEQQYRSSGICTDRVHPPERGLPGESADFLPEKQEAERKKKRYLNDENIDRLPLGIMCIFRALEVLMQFILHIFHFSSSFHKYLS